VSRRIIALAGRHSTTSAATLLGQGGPQNLPPSAPRQNSGRPGVDIRHLPYFSAAFLVVELRFDFRQAAGEGKS
jgi:hypothetical protein